MKHVREIKVAALVLVCGFLVYFGLNFLKGIDIFSPVKHYVGIFRNVSGLTVQAPVYVRGYKVGQVESISYNFTQEDAFTIVISLDKNIVVSSPAEMRLFDDGVLGGKAIEVVVPAGDPQGRHLYADGDTLPAIVVPGLLETLQEGFMAKVDDTMEHIDSLIVNVNSQIDKHALQETLENVQNMSEDLSASAKEIKYISQHQLPSVVQNADTMIADAKQVVRTVKEVDLQGTVNRVDQVVDTLHNILASTDGTVGLLLNDKNLYNHIDSTVVSVDSLVSDLKANPKRYVHFSLFGGKDKEKKNKAK
ncbi:MAG: MlaD family protein [Paludibacteraceae bacterium]|nr:MlaD family protein [Paludibacteraceae bacterium]